jgi:hypothetical protein
MDKNERISVLLMVVLLAFAVVLVDERLLRTAVAVLPALMLAQKAMRAGEEAPAPAVSTTPQDDRRHDLEMRAHVEQLLKHFREFYTTCHLMSVNVLTIEAAEERAANLERDLNQLLGRITQTARERGVRTTP